MKGEAYDEAKEPRIISTLSPDLKLAYSRYTYTMSDYISSGKFPWYAFGKPPKGIAQRVAEICRYARVILETDFSRMDGRINNLLRTLEKMIYLAMFHPAHHPELIALMEKQYKQKGVTRLHVKYDTGDSRLSGSPETSVNNTLVNAFHSYLTSRLRGQPSNDAWDNLQEWGIYGGDDGLVANSDASMAVKAAEMIGLKLKANVKTRGDHYVSFLARIYSQDVWNGNPSSCCDIRRQLLKIHLTPRLPPGVDAITKLREKCRGFIMTDKNTPVIGDLAIVVLQVYGIPKTDHGLMSYFSDYPEHEQYPNENMQKWMDWLVKDQIPTFDMKAFGKWLLAVSKGEADPLSSPLFSSFEEDPPKAPTVPLKINGDLVLPQKEKEEAEPEQKEVKKKAAPTKVCNSIAKGEPCKFGDKCIFLHPERKPSEAGGVCRDFNKAEGCKRAKCKFKHVAQKAVL
nr:RNA-dependent RNA polymerase [Flumine noda-like virus 5]